MENPKYEDFKRNRNLRQIEPNEIVFDVDKREVGFEAINFIGISLYNEGYKFEIYYAEGQKSPHLHIRNILFLDLEEEHLKRYKKLFLQKYTPKQYLEFVDFSLCSKHLIAEENKPHYKYNTIKKLCGVFNPDNENYAEEDLIQKSKRTEQRRVVEGSGVTAKIIQKISILDIAERYGIRKEKNGFCFCPFHSDYNNPNLYFYENQGRFCCFACGVKGNIIDFIYLLRKHKIKELKNGQ